MPERAETSQENKASILADLWLNYRSEEEFADFIEYNDLGLPLAYAISTGIVASSPTAEKFVNETFELLLTALEVEDEGFEDLQELLGMVER